MPDSNAIAEPDPEDMDVESTLCDEPCSYYGTPVENMDPRPRKNTEIASASCLALLLASAATPDGGFEGEDGSCAAAVGGACGGLDDVPRVLQPLRMGRGTASARAMAGIRSIMSMRRRASSDG